MENELVQPAGNNDDNFSLINLNSTTEKINKTISKIKDDYIYIGFLLWEVREYKFYLSKGYESVVCSKIESLFLKKIINNLSKKYIVRKKKLDDYSFAISLNNSIFTKIKLYLWGILWNEH